jgi:hypothetical protein
MTALKRARCRPKRKKHVQGMFDKLGVETRGAAAVRALEVLNAQSQSM